MAQEIPPLAPVCRMYAQSTCEGKHRMGDIDIYWWNNEYWGHFWTNDTKDTKLIVHAPTLYQLDEALESKFGTWALMNDYKVIKCELASIEQRKTEFKYILDELIKTGMLKQRYKHD